MIDYDIRAISASHLLMIIIKELDAVNHYLHSAVISMCIDLDLVVSAALPLSMYVCMQPFPSHVTNFYMVSIYH